MLSNVSGGGCGHLQRGGERGVRHGGDQQREPDGQHGGGCQCVERRGELPWRGSDASARAATGTGLYSYQWYLGGNVLAGQTGSSLALSSGERDGCGGLQCGGERGVRRRGDQQREPDGEPERGGGQRPVSVTNCPGTSASFSVSATGTGLSYQWY